MKKKIRPSERKSKEIREILEREGEGALSLKGEPHSVKVYLGASTAVALPGEFDLDQNYPNPFNPVTAIRYQLATKSQVRLKVYNMLGQHLATLVDEIQDAGLKRVEWDARNFPSEVYFYRIEAVDGTREFRDLKAMLLVK